MSSIIEISNGNLVISPHVNTRFQYYIDSLGREKALTIFSEGMSEVLEDMEDSIVIKMRNKEKGTGVSLADMKKTLAHV